MSENNIREQYKLLQRAKKMEKMGSAERALDLYLELHDLYQPNTSDAYERPAVLLERAKRYKEAINMCKRAIEGIEGDTISGTVDKFEKRLDSIYDKMKDQPAEDASAVSYVFHIHGFHESSLLSKGIFGVYYLLAIALSIIFKDLFIAAALIGGLYGFKFLFSGLTLEVKEKKLLILLGMTLVVITVYALSQWPQAFKENIIFVDTTEALEGGENIFSPDKTLPLIKDSHLKEARELIEKERAVVESLIYVNENDITLGLVLYKNTSKETSKELLGSFAKHLADLVAKDNTLEGSTKKSFGELYDFFHLYVTATEEGATILSKGSKNTKSSKLIWE